ncbi:sigma 54-interacting transcriptional regulator [Desulfotalea psychrophila]|uniref:HTH-type transcriptional regulatory protein TyrR n=1 Tax=Desulfotalea psychrophila (strain LSv54 / DSM 12343) TaxID=177439 RepID=Q6AQV5_DESPS|nr:sigma 54-interacting transcriptional regulator [Desulfotalea psychrophila]CAG35268.1 related to sigma-54 transcriptional regulator [Desulfotalea psychrophila LSv54]
MAGLISKYICPEYRQRIADNLSGIFNLCTDGLYITNREGITLALNRAYEELMGLRAEDLLARSVYDLDADGIFVGVEHAGIVRTGESFSSVQLVGDKKILLAEHPLFDVHGEVELVVTFVRDVTHSSEAGRGERASKVKEELLSKEHRLVAQSSGMLDLLQRLEWVASTDATILLLGEPGVGKDILARKIHEMSPRRDKKFFKIDCTHIAENFEESELVDQVSKKFSGIDIGDSVGFLTAAEHGTLFLDGIGELPLPLQSRLLEALQDGRGDVRIIAGTRRNLEEEVKAGRFRQDLFYRLRVAVSHIPPLRERKVDIIPLAHMFFERFCLQYQRRLRLLPEVEEAMSLYQWPGNVWELENIILSLVVSCENEAIGLADLPLAIQDIHRGQGGDIDQGEQVAGLDLHLEKFFRGKSLKDIMEAVEKEAIRYGMQNHDSISSLAKVFKVERSTLSRKVKKYGISS